MSTTEARLAELAKEHLDLDGPPAFDMSLADSGVSSMDAAAFLKAVSSEFGISVEIGAMDADCSLRRIAEYIDAQ
ncbi:MAG: phosphopantetheine-binding protein [Gammaproteobacteria bacterium]|nr:phosphopantetheine-binding protein [Gammaproteobacteria bacterium]MDE2753329.1 phosphopantetheine-binding protein [Gemmatimonadota bacterium]